MLSGLGIGLSLAGGYIFTSCFLFKFPQYFPRKCRKKFRPSVPCAHISHRGGAGEYLENTMSAFRNAVDLGTNMLEIDVQLTKDEFVVISHDNNLHRLTGFDALISETNYRDLPLLKPSINLDFDRGNCCKNENDRKIVLLDDLFKKFPSMPINVDIKTDNDKLIHEVSEMIVAHDRVPITVWGNYQNSITSKCYKQNPNIPIFFSLRQVILLLFYMYTGLLPFISLKESCLELFLPSVIMKSKSDLMNSRRGRLFAYLVKVYEILLMKKSLFNHLQKRGIDVYVWVLNEEDDFKIATDLGVDGIMTDYPTRLKDFLKNYHVD